MDTVSSHIIQSRINTTNHNCKTLGEYGTAGTVNVKN
jgi:hypothetical protein